jgi:transposase
MLTSWVSTPGAPCDLRDLRWYRSTFIRERATLVNRVQNLCEDANIALAAVATGRLHDKRAQLVKALAGRVKPHPHLVLTALLCQIDSLDETIARLAARIAETSGPFEEGVALSDTPRCGPPFRRDDRGGVRHCYAPLSHGR